MITTLNGFGFIADDRTIVAFFEIEGRNYKATVDRRNGWKAVVRKLGFGGVIRGDHRVLINQQLSMIESQDPAGIVSFARTGEPSRRTSR